ncbi:hypothetical protein Tco_1416788 [Tanacetum coccineum]
MHIPGVYLIHDFISAQEEEQLLAAVDVRPWHNLAKRMVQNYGYEFCYNIAICSGLDVGHSRALGWWYIYVKTQKRATFTIRRVFLFKAYASKMLRDNEAPLDEIPGDCNEALLLRLLPRLLPKYACFGGIFRDKSERRVLFSEL